MRRLQLFLLLGYLFFSFSSLANGANSQIWLLIDTKKLTLEVKKGGKTINVMKNISIGRNGAGFKKKIGDDITPLGLYKIGWINDKSPFYRFYGFNYPSVENANKGLISGLINQQSYTTIINAHRHNKTPPQNTPMGGRIGIHGLGKGDEKIHKMMNWTHGCIALTNEQMDQLGRWIGKGVLVRVK